MEQKTGEAVEKTFGERPEKVERIEEGLIHETFSVTVDGEDYILQFSGREDENHSALNQCLKFYELLSETVPVPEAVTEKVQEIDGEEYIIVEKIEVKSAEKDITSEKTRRAGKALARIHNFTVFRKEGWIKFQEEDKGPEELLEGLEVFEFREETSKRRKLSELEEKIEIFRDEGLEELATGLENFVEENGEVFPEDFEAVVVHDDYTPDNVIYSGDRIAGIIDFDYAHSGLDVRDLVKSANAFWMHDPDADWDIREAFYEGYRSERPLPDDFEALESFFRVETLAHMVASLVEMDELSRSEIEFYRDEILKEIDGKN